MPASPEDLLQYASWLVLTGRAKCQGTVKNHLSAVRTFHKLLGLQCSVPSEYGPLQLAVRGLSRHFNRLIHQAPPITWRVLLQMTQILDSMSPDRFNIWPIHRIISRVISTCLKVAFFSMLRCDNLVPSSTGKFEPRRQLVWGRVGLLPGCGAVLKVVLAKNLQDGSREVELPIPEMEGVGICPVTALKDLLTIPGYPCSPLSPVFSMPATDGSWLPVSRYQLDKVFQALVHKLGLVGEQDIHGIRRGGLQLALVTTGSMDLVRTQSFHKSEAVQTYLHLPPQYRQVVSGSMINAVVQNIW